MGYRVHIIMTLIQKYVCIYKHSLTAVTIVSVTAQNYYNTVHDNYYANLLKLYTMLVI